MKTDQTKLVEAILDTLGGHKGFKGWWNQIDRDIQEEIMSEMEEVINEFQKKPLPFPRPPESIVNFRD